MTNLDYYLTYDHAARTRTSLISVLAGIAAGMFSEELGMPFKAAALVCIFAVGAIELSRAWWYQRPLERKRQPATLPPFSRRALLLLPASALLFLFAALFPIAHIEAAVLERKLKWAAADPSAPRNIHESEGLLTAAKNQAIKIRPEVIKDAGNRFVNVSDDDKEAWPTALEYLDYRSFLNDSLAPNEHREAFIYFPANVTEIRAPAPIVDWNFKLPFIGDHYMLVNETLVPAERAARFEPIGSSENAARKTGYQTIIVDGKKQSIITLDGFLVKDSVIRNAMVVYKGGPVILDHVYFVNCSFALPSDKYGRRLAAEILDSPNVKFFRLQP